MPTYVVLVNWTDQGIRAVKESPQRFACIHENEILRQDIQSLRPLIGE